MEPSCPPAGTLEQVNTEIETQSPSKVFAVVHISKYNLYGSVLTMGRMTVIRDSQ